MRNGRQSLRRGGSAQRPPLIREPSRSHNNSIFHPHSHKNHKNNLSQSFTVMALSVSLFLSLSYYLYPHHVPLLCCFADAERPAPSSPFPTAHMLALHSKHVPDHKTLISPCSSFSCSLYFFFDFPTLLSAVQFNLQRGA